MLLFLISLRNCLFFKELLNMNFTYFYKQKYSGVDEIKSLKYDILISTFNPTERVCETFKALGATDKYLIVLPEYKGDLFLPTGKLHYVDVDYNGYDKLSLFLDELEIKKETKLCIDLTGFIVPHILFLIRYLQKTKKVKIIDIFYTEPLKYIQEENTDFSDYFRDVAQIYGYGSTPNPNMENDLLIIASGYDDSRITDVAGKKKGARKIQLFGFPPLQADMFQENMLKAYRAEAAVGSDGFKNLELNLYAPAHDPFVAAQTIQDYINKEQRISNFSNIYLAPVSSKPHALGMALYYIWENVRGDKPISLLYPNCEKYFGNTSVGISKIWKYVIQLP